MSARLRIQRRDWSAHKAHVRLLYGDLSHFVLTSVSELLRLSEAFISELKITEDEEDAAFLLVDSFDMQPVSVLYDYQVIKPQRC